MQQMQLIRPRECRDNSTSSFWPVAVIVGLVPGKVLQVPIVITAEDGITSLSYTVRTSKHRCISLHAYNVVSWGSVLQDCCSRRRLVAACCTQS